MKSGRVVNLVAVLLIVTGLIAINLRGIPDTAILARALGDVVPLAAGVTAGCITAMGFIALGTLEGLSLVVSILLSGAVIISLTGSNHLIGNPSALAAMYTQIVVMSVGICFIKE